MTPAERHAEWPVGAKSLLWRAYRAYKRHFPVDRGKWRLAVMLRSLFGPAEVVIQGLRLELFPVSYMDEMLLDEGHYESEIEALIQERLSPGEAFVDIGANLGWFSLLAARRGADVFAFEPSPQELARLNRHVILNCAARVHVRAVALGAERGELTLHLAGDGNPGATSLRPSFAGVQNVVVPVRPLHEELQAADLERVRLVKIDVEGWEMEVLRGIEPCMCHLGRATFVLEVTPAWLREAGTSVESLYGFFERHGFRWRTGAHDAFQYTEVFEAAGRERT